MKSLAAVLVLASSAIAHAEVDGAVAAGVGGDSSSPDRFATETSSITAHVDSPAAPLLQRGMFLADPEHPDETRLWVFTGLDPADHDGAGVTADATLHVGETSQAYFSARAWARSMGWQFELRSVFQPVGDLRDRFWRSGRGVFANNVAFEIPAMFAIGDAHRQFLALLWTIDLGARTLDNGDSAGFDRDVGMTGFRAQTPTSKVDVLDLHYTEFGVATATVGDTTFGTSATAIDLDALAIQWRAQPDVAITARGGLAMRMPVSPYQITNSAEVSTGPVATLPSYWVELAKGTGALDPYTSGYTTTLGAGTWARLDPTGHAVDAGHLASAAADWRNGRYHVKSELQLGRLHRILLGDLAPAGLLPAGTAMTMGRASLLASVKVTPSTLLTTTAWLEHSDRDDPRWQVPSNGELTTHAGADLTAEWRFRRL